MTILGDTFNIIVFVSFVGSIFSVLALLVRKVLHIALPLWFGVCGIALFLFPVVVPTLWLVSPEETLWINGYKVACTVWLVGFITFAFYFIVRSILALYALKKYRVCSDEHINQVYTNCQLSIGIKTPPILYFGTLSEPACVVTIFRPAIILNETVIKQLSDKELTIVLCHELTHIQRKHHVYQRIFDFASTIHWFNPFVWISKNDFAAHCEMDCDQKVLSVMSGKITEIEYATTMLRLMELSSQRRGKTNGIKALGYLLAKQRMNFILNEPTVSRRRIGIVILVLSIVLTIFLSFYVSRSYFYPFPAFDTGPEYPVHIDTF